MASLPGPERQGWTWSAVSGRPSSHLAARLLVAQLLLLDCLCRMPQLPQEKEGEQKERGAHGEADPGSGQPVHCGERGAHPACHNPVPAAHAPFPSATRQSRQLREVAGRTQQIVRASL